MYRQDGSKTEFGPYLDLDQTLDEQREELESFTEGYKWSIVLRTQLSVRVNACIGNQVRKIRLFLERFSL